MNWLAITQTTVTGDLGKHGIVTLFPCLNCDNLVWKKCLSLCLEVHCYHDWLLQNCWLQHLQCFVTFSFKCLWTKGQKKVFYHLMHSSLSSVVRRSQTLTQMNVHNAEGNRADWRGNPMRQGASRLSEPWGLCQWDCHQNVWRDAISVQTSMIVLGSSGAHNFVHRGGLRQDRGHPSSFSAVPGGVAL